ncbi:hypothetical protein LRS13_15825 [Svornostia abyssi]|uniref:PIN domain-containing protein n=1 Tax=Svornostia abyssi TaxID=2898438 RepID=A0ABY5PC22_9ACTN|nr:hypothetical protein LRS13_15825 [Parviterribacteraceae bacterium J379]
MIDTMVFDAVADDPETRAAITAATRDGRIKLFTTQIQEDQLAAVPDPARRKRLRALPREVLPPVAPDGSALVDAVHAGQNKHMADALIAGTALARCDVLVTEDARLTARAGGLGLEVWNVDRLLRATG